jgi:hypothetical protein
LTEYSCDLCGSRDAEEIAVLRSYTGGQQIHVCKQCGFVYVRNRRPAQVIADAWSHEVYGKGYTARIPAVKARQVYVADTIDSELGLRDKLVCDIGAGEGQFLDIVRSPEYGAKVFGIEPSPDNCKALAKRGFECFEGIIEDYLKATKGEPRRFDIVTIMWTLENCEDCRAMMAGARDLLPVGGYVVAATGSRLLVPFKKPLQGYVRPTPTDLHCFRFSANTLRGLLALHGFETVFINRHVDSEYLCVIGRKVASESLPWPKDDWREIVDFFNRWDKESRSHFAEFRYSA